MGLIPFKNIKKKKNTWQRAQGFDLASKLPDSQSNRTEQWKGRKAALCIPQDPKDPLCHVPEDTLEGHLSISWQVKAWEGGMRGRKRSCQTSWVPLSDLVKKDIILLSKVPYTTLKIHFPSEVSALFQNVCFVALIQLSLSLSMLSFSSVYVNGCPR